MKRSLWSKGFMGKRACQKPPSLLCVSTSQMHRQSRQGTCKYRGDRRYYSSMSRLKKPFQKVNRTHSKPIDMHQNKSNTPRWTQSKTTIVTHIPVLLWTLYQSKEHYRGPTTHQVKRSTSEITRLDSNNILHMTKTKGINAWRLLQSNLCAWIPSLFNGYESRPKIGDPLASFMLVHLKVYYFKWLFMCKIGIIETYMYNE